MAVIIGIDPHESTHTAVAIDGEERLECAHLFWPHLSGVCSSDLAPPR